MACTSSDSRFGLFHHLHSMVAMAAMTKMAVSPKMYRVNLCIPAVSLSVLLAVFKASASGTRKSMFKINSGHFLSLFFGKKKGELTAHISDLSSLPSPPILAKIRRLYPLSMILFSCKYRKVPKKSSIWRSLLRESWSNITLSAQRLHLSLSILSSPNVEITRRATDLASTTERVPGRVD